MRIIELNSGLNYKFDEEKTELQAALPGEDFRTTAYGEDAVHSWSQLLEWSGTFADWELVK